MKLLNSTTMKAIDDKPDPYDPYTRAENEESPL